MSGKKNGKKKISRKKQATARYKWLKVIWWKFDEIEERLDKNEKAIKLINEKLNIIEQGESDERKKKRKG